MKSSNFVILIFAAAMFLTGAAWFAAATPPAALQSGIRVGEKITYSVSFGRFSNVAYAEINAASRGKIGSRDAVELRGRFKTLDFVSAAFYLIDESRTVYVDAESGVPLFVSVLKTVGTQPRETTANFLSTPAPGFDLLSLIYKMRQSAGTGTFQLVEDGRTYLATMTSGLVERVKTEAGEYDTTVVAVQSDFFTERGIKDLRINLSNDDSRVPAMVRLKTAKGEFKMTVASVQLNEPETAAAPVLVPGPPDNPTPTPQPVATPTPYIDNQPLAAELAFDLGEMLDYRITENGQNIALARFEARERRQIEGVDSLVLTGTITKVEPNVTSLSVGDSVTARVNPETLAPFAVETRFTGVLSRLNQSLKFDAPSGSVMLGGASRVDAPNGTHSLLSLFYAMRSFNLKPSRDTSNPVNDTRVAVFWENQPYIFTLRPSQGEQVTVGGQSISAQLITITTANPALDRLNIRVWLSLDEKRLPVKFAIGSFEAELIAAKN